MNIFALDMDPKLAAQYHCDQHVNKMILESAQMLSTVLGGEYAPTHANHPCTLWVGKSQANARWLVQLCHALNAECQARYGHRRNHKSMDIINACYLSIDQLPDLPITPFALAMPDTLRNPDDPVQSYRDYYRLQKSFATWRNGKPHWM
jgi:hypothetical protein